MAILNAGQMRTMIATALDVDVSAGDGPTVVLNCMNWAGDRVWRSRKWYGRETETTIFAVGPYTTGTCDFTNGSTTLAGTNTVWTAAMTGRKIARGLGQPWYRFTRTGATAGTIPTGGYNEATSLLSNYIIFQDEYDLPSTAETITDVNLYSALFNGKMSQTTMARLDELWFTNPTQGTPWLWAPVVSQTAGVRRIRITYVPDAAYRLRILYTTAFTDLTGASDTPVFRKNLERAWFLASCLEVQRVCDTKQVTNDQEVEEAINLAFKGEQAQVPMTMRKVPLGSGRPGYGFPQSDDNITGL